MRDLFCYTVHMFAQLESILISFANTLPLEVFVFIASFVEEVIAPIPSPTVMLVAGSFARVQDYAFFALVLLALIGAVGKTVGALVVYFITDKGEDFVMEKFGKFFGVTHEDVEKLGKKLGNGVRDYVVLTLLRAFPFMPSVVVSVGGGLLKVPLPLFITSTFLGTILRDGLYLYAGYAGATALFAIINKSSNLETYIEVLVALAVVGFIVYRIYHRNSRNHVKDTR